VTKAEVGRLRTGGRIDVPGLNTGDVRAVSNIYVGTTVTTIIATTIITTVAAPRGGHLAGSGFGFRGSGPRRGQSILIRRPA
jgi:hypothetical protein